MSQITESEKLIDFKKQILDFERDFEKLKSMLKRKELKQK